jgi:hypothetical protein
VFCSLGKSHIPGRKRSGRRRGVRLGRRWTAASSAAQNGQPQETERHPHRQAASEYSQERVAERVHLRRRQ